MKEKDGIYERLDEENARRRHLYQSDNPPQKPTDEDEAHPDMTGVQYGPSDYNSRKLEDHEDEAKKQKRLWLRIEIHKIDQTLVERYCSIFEESFQWIYNSPMKNWEGMLFCLKYGFQEHDDKHWALKGAKDLFDKLK